MWTFEAQEHIAAIDDSGAALTYRQLAEEGRKLAVQTGGRCLVFCLCRNDLGSLLGYTAFLNHGVVPALLPADMDPEMLQTLLDSYHPRYIWAPEGLNLGGGEQYSALGYKLLKTPFADSPQLYPELALLLATSGSTGSPKFVRQSYQNIRANTDSIVEYLRLGAQERPITTLPMHYTYGLSIISTHLDVGATILFTRCGIAQKGFWSFFKERRATSFGGVPYTYEMLDRMHFTRMDLPSLRTMTQAGGKLLPGLHEKFAWWCWESGRQFIVMYGQCEATARMAYLPWEHGMDKIGAMGVAIPGGRFELIGADGSLITKPHVTGELRYYGDNVTLGYASGAEDLAKGDERGGVLDTGDMAQVDDDGFYTIVGRKKRFVKLFGNRVNLDETERMLKVKFPGSDLACGGRDDRLVIYGTDGALLLQMKTFLAEKTGLHPSGFAVKAVSRIPKNDAGKTLYRELETPDD
ncbi:MAG: AMP-binding protein [Bacillota bacterium]